MLSVSAASPTNGDDEDGATGSCASILGVQETPLLHHLLLQLLRVGSTAPHPNWEAATAAARQIVKACSGFSSGPVYTRVALWPHMEASLERLLHATLDSAASSRNDAGRRCMGVVLSILRGLESYESVVGRAARHSDVGHWPLLFAKEMAGPPSALFDSCLAKATAENEATVAMLGVPHAAEVGVNTVRVYQSGSNRHLRTAALYLVILQETENSTVVQAGDVESTDGISTTAALRLLGVALRVSDLSLAAELVSFLRRAESWRQYQQGQEGSRRFHSHHHHRHQRQGTEERYSGGLESSKIPNDSPLLPAKESSLASTAVPPSQRDNTSSGGWFSFLGFGTEPEPPEDARTPRQHDHKCDTDEVPLPPVQTVVTMPAQQELSEIEVAAQRVDAISAVVEAEAEEMLLSLRLSSLAALPYEMDFEIESWLHQVAHSTTIDLPMVADIGDAVSKLDMSISLPGEISVHGGRNGHDQSRRKDSTPIGQTAQLSKLLSHFLRVAISMSDDTTDDTGSFWQQAHSITELALLLATKLRDLPTARAVFKLCRFPVDEVSVSDQAPGEDPTSHMPWVLRRYNAYVSGLRT